MNYFDFICKYIKCCGDKVVDNFLYHPKVLLTRELGLVQVLMRLTKMY
jgi:hypothetical protein